MRDPAFTAREPSPGLRPLSPGGRGRARPESVNPYKRRFLPVTSCKMLRDANHSPSHDLERLHDLCLVWPLKVSRVSTLESHHGELADRFSGILLPGSGKPNRLLPVLD